MKTVRMTCSCGATLWFRDFNYWSDVETALVAWIKAHAHNVIPHPVAEG